MKTRHGIAAVALIVGLALTVLALAAGGKGQAAQTQTRSTNQIQKQQRTESCTQSGTPQGTQAKKGNTYGPGGGSGDQGVGPKDGTGFGAPSNR